MTKTITVFRTFTDSGGVIALFPEVPATANGEFCSSYMHVGQHGAAYSHLHANSRPSTPEEIAPLKKELESIGYIIEERKRVSFAMDQKRFENAKSI